jgi:anti-sigma B factor antagonist
MATAEAQAGNDGFGVRTEANGDALLVRAFGEVDIASAKTLEKKLRRAFGNGTSSVLLDLGDVSFIDAGGLSVLLAAARLSVLNDRPLRIVRVSAPVGRVIELSGVEGALPIGD